MPGVIFVVLMVLVLPLAGVTVGAYESSFNDLIVDSVSDPVGGSTGNSAVDREGATPGQQAHECLNPPCGSLRQLT